MTSSLTDLPGEVLEEIFLFVPTPRALCRLGTTCSSLSEAVTTNERVWNHIYKKRWIHRDSSVEEFSYRDYKARHLEDGKTLKRLLKLSDIVAKKEDYGLGREFRERLWNKLLGKLNSFDLLRSVAKNDPQLQTLYERTPFSLITRCLATQLVDWVHFGKLMHQMNVFMNDFSLRNPSDCLVEDIILLMGESQRPWQELLLSNASMAERIDTTRHKLDELGRQLQSRINEHGSHVDPSGVVGMLYTMLVDEMRISITDAQNNVELASIERVLQPSGSGWSITVAVIIKCILRRVGVLVTVFLGKERVILGLPGNVEAYVDVFAGCVPLSGRDLRTLQSHGDVGTLLLTNSMIVKVMDDSVCHCVETTMHSTRTTRIYAAREKACSFSFLISCSTAGMVEVEASFEQSFQYLDPGVFSHYNLINDDTMRRHDESPFLAEEVAMYSEY